MTCPRALEELSAYVDGSLGPEEELSLRRHIDTCAVCQPRLKTLSALKETVARSAEVHPVPHTLRQALSVRSHHPSWSFLRRPWTAKAMLAFVLVLAVISLAGWWWQQRGARGYEEVAQVLVADHIHYLQVPDAVEIASAKPAEVAAWFRERVSFPVRLPAWNDTRLLGGRLCSLLGQQVALAFYERGGKRLSLFTLAMDAIPPGEKAKIQAANQNNPRCVRTFGKYALCLMSARDVVVAVVAEGPETEDLVLSLFRSFEEGAL